jgi:hypothetical protein
MDYASFLDAPQEHRSFIDWFIAVTGKMRKNRHQTEIKMYEHHFYKCA